MVAGGVGLLRVRVQNGTSARHERDCDGTRQGARP
ncbi:hypothetical protein GGE06_008089 [Streptomyces sp. SFB5A]|uniref:Uncharacterized protein n=1 Tax=Streptomyces nymphaeiformis TaxID=2663842 RepID=A0A7W7UAB6_9ACTN|nr:hypothetical protein [Streptomyces nymphaeiformis]